MKRLKLLLIFATAVIIAQSAYSQTLSIQDYLSLVEQNNSELKSVQANIDAVKGKIAELERAYSFDLSAGVNYVNDQSGRPFSLQSLRLDRSTNLSYDLSLDKEFVTGTQFSLGVNGSYSQYKYNVTGSSYEVNDLAPFFRLEQSLLKNFNGGSRKAGILKAKADAKSALYLLEYKKQSILLNAKIAYWNLSYTRTVVDFRNTSLERTKKIYEWNERRYKLDLAEKSDMLQSQAAVKVRELNLKLAKEDADKAERSFYQLLNLVDERGDYEVQKFEEIGTTIERTTKTPLEKKGIRYDVLSALEDVESAKYEQKASKKNLGSDLVLSGQVALNGIDQTFNKAIDYVGEANKPTFMVGLRYTLPLDFKLRKTINTGYEASKLSAQKAAEFISIQESNDWFQLLDDWSNAKTRLKITKEVESIQKQRNEEDQNLLRKGRTTTYLVLQSEQDLDDATLSVFHGIYELITIYEKAEAFYGSNTEIKL